MSKPWVGFLAVAFLLLSGVLEVIAGNIKLGIFLMVMSVVSLFVRIYLSKSCVKKITIKEYEPAYQPGIDSMMEMIQREFRERITSSHSTVIKDVYQKPGQKYWIAWSDGVVVGTIGIVLFNDKMAEVKRMMVHPGYRGKTTGTASELLNTGLQWAGDQGAKIVYLGTMPQFKAAQKFYEQNKFSPVSPDMLPAEYKINPMDSLFYKLELN